MKIKITILVIGIIINNILIGFSELETLPFDMEEAAKLSEKIHCSFHMNEEKNEKFEEFAISNNGDYAVLIREGLSNIIVNVYDEKCDFLYSYTFNTAQHVLLLWDESFLGVFLSRSSVILYYDNQGTLEKCEKVLSTKNNNKAISDITGAERIIIGGSEYFASNDGIREDHRKEKSMLLVKYKNGETAVLYEAITNPGRLSVLGFVSICSIIFFIFLIIYLRRYFKTSNRDL